MKIEIIAQRLLLVFVLCSGYFIVIAPPTYFYGLLFTVLFCVTLLGGLYADRNNKLLNNSGFFPTVSVIIPAKDEEHIIYEVIKRYAEVEYPKEKIEVFVVDDGSQDKTSEEIERAIKDFENCLKIKSFRFKVNGGKRKALAYAIRRCSGEIIVINDSDSFIDRYALNALIPLFEDEKVAGVCGHAYVRNKKNNLLTMMQSTLYFYYSRIVRGFQGLFGSVLCLPGTLSAFRKEKVMEVLDEWERSTPPLGEDRHLTYLLLARGCKTLYSKEAKCETIVPETFKRYVQQQLRWAKGYLVETFRGCKHMYKRHPLIAFIYYLEYFLALYTPFAIIRIYLLFLTVSPYWWSYFVFVGCALCLKSLISGYQSRDKTTLAILLFLFVNLILEMWRIPFALLTISEKMKWTRSNKK